QAGAAFGTQPSVALIDAGGNVAHGDTSAVTLVLTTPGSATLACGANPKDAVAGVATFTGCNVDVSNTYTLDASDGVLPGVSSDPFVISGAAAAALEFVTPPTGGAIGAAWTVQPVLRFVDAFGNTATSAGLVSIEVVIGPPTTNGVECTSNPQAAVNGVITFAECTINTASSPPRTWSLQFVSDVGVLTAPVTEH
ncbi:MAG: hypothetical protein JWL73_1361, partial [Actinomycetia bacterium]|nr:hypothetical protein [Actinomycetes bacterium]